MRRDQLLCIQPWDGGRLVESILMWSRLKRLRKVSTTSAIQQRKRQSQDARSQDLYHHQGEFILLNLHQSSLKLTSICLDLALTRLTLPSWGGTILR